MSTPRPRPTLVILALIVGCSATTKNAHAAVPQTPLYVNLAIKKLSDDFLCEMNSDSTHVVCATLSKSSLDFPRASTRFFIYDIVSDELLLEDSVAGGAIRWLNANDIEISTIPGVIPDDEHFDELMTGYIYNVKDRAKFSRIMNGASSPK